MKRHVWIIQIIIGLGCLYCNPSVSGIDSTTRVDKPRQQLCWKGRQLSQGLGRIEGGLPRPVSSLVFRILSILSGCTSACTYQSVFSTGSFTTAQMCSGMSHLKKERKIPPLVSCFSDSTALFQPSVLKLLNAWLSLFPHMHITCAHLLFVEIKFT